MYGRKAFAQLSEISVAHLYRLRKMYTYRQHSLTVHKTHPKQVPTRHRRPRPWWPDSSNESSGNPGPFRARADGTEASHVFALCALAYHAAFGL